VISDLAFLAAGWSLGLFASLRLVAANRDRLIERRSRSSRRDVNWRFFGPYLLGLCLTLSAGIGLQHQSIGHWVLPVALVPLFLAAVIPIWLHNSRLRRPHVDRAE
jgi:hypothetical protein